MRICPECGASTIRGDEIEHKKECTRSNLQNLEAELIKWQEREIKAVTLLEYIAEEYEWCKCGAAKEASDFIALEPQYNLPDPFLPAWGGAERAGMKTLEPGGTTSYRVSLEALE